MSLAPPNLLRRISPWLVAVALFAAAIIAIRPWGDYPLNDDWQYARAAKQFAETGSIRIDTPVAPALVGQLLLAYPVIRIFGMNHAYLRAITWGLAAFCLFAIDRLLTLASVSPRLRMVALATLALNPLFLYFSNTFMTEFYGFAPALAAAVVYFEYRKRIPDGGSLSRDVAAWALVAFLAVFSFWTRQFAALIFLALLAAWIFAAPWTQAARRIKTWAPAAAGFLIFAVGSAAYFAWARASGNFSFAFGDPLRRMVHIDVRAWGVETGAAIVYLTAFFAPLLFLAAARKLNGAVSWISGCLLFAAAMFARSWFKSHSTDHLLFSGWVHDAFPYVTNVIYRTGIGPITLDDVYAVPGDRPHWTADAWQIIEWALLIGVFLWGFFFRRWRLFAATESKRKSLRFEMGWFVLVWTFASWSVTVQAYRLEIFDRYYFPIVLGFSILLPLLLTAGNPEPGRWRPNGAVAVLCAAVIGWFSIAGLHDHFRWNDARWELARFAFSQGVSPQNLAAGYEVNGWENYDNFQKGIPPSDCRGACRPCGMYWNCSDDSYRIGMNVWPGYEVWKQEQPSYWLAPGPPVMLLRRIQ